MDEGLETYFSITGSARLLGISRQTVHKAIDAGFLKVIRPQGDKTRLRRIHRDDLAEWWGDKLPDERALKKAKESRNG